VWKARSATGEQNVALKQLAPAARPAEVERLSNEVESLAALKHPNLASVMSLVDDGGQLWLAEAWIDGATLDGVLRARGSLTGPQGAAVVRGALKGLAYAHRNRLVHGALGPSTIIIDQRGTAKLTDFGVLLPPRDTAYLSPEAARGLPTSPRSDVYSAAAVLATALGQPGQSEGGSTLDQRLQALLDRARSIDPTARYPDAEEFLEALEDTAERCFGEEWLEAADLGALARSAAIEVMPWAPEPDPVAGPDAGLALPSGAPVAMAPPPGGYGPPAPAGPSEAPLGTDPATRPRPRGGSHAAPRRRPDHVVIGGHPISLRAAVIGAAIVGLLVIVCIILLIAG
jgi:hypothetical protein